MKHIKSYIPQRLIWGALAATVILFTTGCANNFKEIALEVSNQRALDLGKYDQVIYTDLILESPPENYDPHPALKVFFLNDMKTIIDKSVAYMPAEGATPDERIKFITDKLNERKKTMLISGVMTFSINTRSKIEDKENKEGKKERQFVKLQQWIVTMDIRMTDLETGKTFFTNKYSDKISDPDANKAHYNFESVFFKLNNRLSYDISTVRRMQRRYLLKE